MLGIYKYPENSELEDFEIEALEYSRGWHKSGTAYAQEHGTRPNTISFALNSNPLALLAW
jgi:microsomal epoxide hydrolase